jgi:hypothetical protein
MLETISPQPTPRMTIKRKLAYLLSRAGKGEMYADSLEQKIRYDKYLALMLWDLITHGEAYFAGGEMIKITEIKEWTELVKFLAVHMDGPAVLEQTNNTQINVYKIYSNIDESRL